jgi:MFS family permease
MLVAGVIFNVVGIFLAAECHTYWQAFLAQGLCIGLGSGLLYIPSLSLVAGSFTTKRPIALGILASGIGVGAIVFVVVFRGLIATYGFRYTVRAIGNFQHVINTIYKANLLRLHYCWDFRLRHSSHFVLSYEALWTC